MKGIILAGGRGTRLSPLTNITNKHLLPVYMKPMIEYPLQTLIDCGCKEILIVTGGEHVGKFAEYLGNGERYGVDITYKVQNEADGIASALALAKNFVDKHETFPVILGDNYFETHPHVPPEPTIFLSSVNDARRFGVYDPDTNKVVEKPDIDNGWAVVGFYVYNYSVFDYIPTLNKSARGEYEITDINNWYLSKGAEAYQYKGFWRDMGTPDTLMEVANRVKQL